MLLDLHAYVEVARPAGDLTTSTPQSVRLSPEEVFHAYAPRVYNLARRMLSNETDAEDVTQEVLLQVVRKLDSFRGDACLTTWLHRVTVNAALAWRRKRATRKEQQAPDPAEQFQADGAHAAQVRPWSSSPERQVMSQELRDLIEQAIGRLPAIYRDAYVLSDVEGLPNAEICDLLGLSLPAVKSRLHRARLLMRESLGGYFEERTA